MSESKRKIFTGGQKAKVILSGIGIVEVAKCEPQQVSAGNVVIIPTL